MAARNRTSQSTVAGSLAQAKAITAKLPQPPCELTELERAAFDKIVIAREAALGFSDFELMLVAELAKNTVMTADYTDRIKREGPTVIGGQRGTTRVMNPMLTARDSCIRAMMGLTRMLGITAPVSHEQKYRNNADTAARKVLAKASEPAYDDLI